MGGEKPAGVMKEFTDVSFWMPSKPAIWDMGRKVSLKCSMVRSEYYTLGFHILMYNSKLGSQRFRSHFRLV